MKKYFILSLLIACLSWCSHQWVTKEDTSSSSVINSWNITNSSNITKNTIDYHNNYSVLRIVPSSNSRSHSIDIVDLKNNTKLTVSLPWWDFSQWWTWYITWWDNIAWLPFDENGKTYIVAFLSDGVQTPEEIPADNKVFELTYTWNFTEIGNLGSDISSSIMIDVSSKTISWLNIYNTKSLVVYNILNKQYTQVTDKYSKEYKTFLSKQNSKIQYIDDKCSQDCRFLHNGIVYRDPQNRSITAILDKHLLLWRKTTPTGEKYEIINESELLNVK